MGQEFGIGNSSFGSQIAGLGQHRSVNPLGSGFEDLVGQFQTDMSDVSEVPKDGQHIPEQLTEFSMIMFQASGTITDGNPLTEQVLDGVFSRFCVGK